MKKRLISSKIGKKLKYFSTLIFIVCSICLIGCSSKDITISKSNSYRKEANVGFFSHYKDGLSLNTYNYLASHSLYKEYKKDPLTVINTLEGSVSESRNKVRIIEALANICYLQGKKARSRDTAINYFLSSAMYSYIYLLSADNTLSDMNYDPTKYVVAHYYNYSVQELFRYFSQKDLLHKSSFSLKTITGKNVFFEKLQFSLPYKLEDYEEFLLCSDYETKNFDYFSYRNGLGVPLICKLKQYEPEGLIREITGQSIPGSVILRFDILEKSNQFSAIFEFHDTNKTDSITMGKQKFPLEWDYSTPLAHSLYSHSYLSQIYYTLNPRRTEHLQGLYLVEPYDSNKIPVIMVHGILSDPRTWAQMINTLNTDNEIRKKYQFIFYTYSAGMPIFYSGYLLRKAIKECHDRYCHDEIAKENFKKMVLIGHSMGGLVSKLQVMNNDGKIIEKLFSKEEQEIFLTDITEEQQQIVNDIFNFQPSPYINRVIFLATPHRGSRMAAWSLVHWMTRLIDLPRSIVGRGVHFQGKKELARHTGIAGLDPSSKGLNIINNLSYKKGVHIHSIIGNRRKEVPYGNDGIVNYESSHLDGVESELIVKSGHSVQRNSLAIIEIYRILLLHLEEHNLLKNNDNLKKLLLKDTENE